MDMNTDDWLAPIESIETIQPYWVARCLSHINRYGGRTKYPVSVAAHSVQVLRALPSGVSIDCRKWALLHDAHEIWVGDIPRPICEQLGDALQRIKDEHDVRIMQIFGIELTDADIRAVDEADRYVAVEEQRLYHPSVVDGSYTSAYMDQDRWWKAWIQECQL